MFGLGRVFVGRRGVNLRGCVGLFGLRDVRVDL